MSTTKIRAKHCCRSNDGVGAVPLMYFNDISELTKYERFTIERKDGSHSGAMDGPRFYSIIGTLRERREDGAEQKFPVADYPNKLGADLLLDLIDFYALRSRD